ncbi:MAG: outer membrane protein assembly factor BamE [Gammaproteobacteria bacterium]|nr:outer membrane protein assembly factor BamE [Gammaproteobacteria bacterium]
MKKSRYILILLVFTLLSLSGCGIIYIPDVQQGNMIKAEDVERIKAGMTEKQVRFVLGTPLIQDPFHNDRWDYYYSYQKGGSSKVERRQATVFFRDGKVSRVSKQEFRDKTTRNGTEPDQD